MNDSENTKIIRHQPGQTYQIPELYDIAFDFREVAAEVDFLLDITQQHSGRKIKSAMELASGPAYHVREMARRKLISDGLDLDHRMAEYARELITGEQLTAEIIEGDMRYYKSQKKYDLVYILMASFAQLLTNRDILDNLNCAADLLDKDGIYIISTAHPRDFFGDEKKSTQNEWSMTRGDLTVETCWGCDDDKFDPLTEIDEVTVVFTATTPDGSVRHEFPDRYRRCSMLTFEALVQLSGRFEIVDMYGALDNSLQLSNDSKCWRLVPILRKIK